MGAAVYGVADETETPWDVGREAAPASTDLPAATAPFTGGTGSAGSEFSRDRWGGGDRCWRRPLGVPGRNLRGGEKPRPRSPCGGIWVPPGSCLSPRIDCAPLACPRRC